MLQYFKKVLFITALFSTFFINAVHAATKDTHQIKITLVSKDNSEPIIMATCVLNATGAAAITNVDGVAVINNVPEGNYTLTMSYVGYETITTQINVKSNLNLSYKMVETSLGLDEVKVVARQKVSGASTTSIIGRQAIDHLQAASLADIMQLIPGQLMKNTDLTAQSNLQLRTLTNNNTSAFGASIIVDGMPMSNNGVMTQGGFSSTAFTGTDLRQVAADNIDEVEVIRGIPSAEYGDLTSGLVVVKSKIGVTPYQFKAKLNPSVQNYSLSKGFNAGKAGIFNTSIDYAKAWGDPRAKTRSYGRYSANIGWAYEINRKWHIDTKLRFMQGIDWSGNDPDAVDDGTYTKNRTTTVGLTHNGRISVNKPLMRSLAYTIGANITNTRNEASSFVGTSTGLMPIITATETGYYSVPWKNTSYLATGITENRPANIFAKLSNSFFLHSGKKVMQSFKAGLEYKYDWNSGKGYYNAVETSPYRPNSNGRPRAFSSQPGLHQLSAFVEDNFNWSINKVNKLRVNLGLRFTSLQAFSDVATTALSPRMNTKFSITKWLDIHAGIGLNSKTPGLDYLYPDKKYADRVAANYMPQDNTAGQLLVYHTQVYDVVKSKGLKNATTTKIEAGIDIKLPWGGNISLLAYRDNTPNGFGNATEYFTYYSNVYTALQGLSIMSGQPTTIDYNNPARRDLVFMTTGKIGNTNSSVNKGFEIDMNLGEIKPLHTTFYLSGAYQETKVWSTDMVSENVRSALLPAEYVAYGLTPFKVVYPSGLDFTKYRRFLNTLRIVTNIPSLKMVASVTAQAVWYDWNHSYTADKDAIAWIDGNLDKHDITADMQSGYIGFDGTYRATKPENINSVRISDLRKTFSDSEPSKAKITWNISTRLTKQLGRVGGLSLFVNNSLFYEPYLTGNKTYSLIQQNTGNFSFGAELYLNL